MREAEEEMGRSQAKMWSPLETRLSQVNPWHQLRQGTSILYCSVNQSLTVAHPPRENIISGILFQLRETEVVSR